MSNLRYGLVCVAAISPELRVADVEFNLRAIKDAMARAAAAGCSLAVFPELSLTGYTCGDLFYQSLLLNAAREALTSLAQATAEIPLGVVAALPLLEDGKIYNCAAFLCDGAVVGIVPKTYLPNTQEYYEERWFTSSRYAPFTLVEIGGQRVPFGTDLLFRARNLKECVIGIEICEDLWVVHPPSSDKALGGATILVNPSASDNTAEKTGTRNELFAQQSSRCLAAYAYAGAGASESTTDAVFAGHSAILENGVLLAQSELFRFETQMAIADVDVELLINARTRNTSFSAQTPVGKFRSIEFTLPTPHPSKTLSVVRPLSQTPFLPNDPAERPAYCREILLLQATALAKRLKHTKRQHSVIGLAGGVDSTLALLATTKAFDTLGLDRNNIHAVAMPGQGTDPRQVANAAQLAQALGVTFRSIPIARVVRQNELAPANVETQNDAGCEPVQARARTQILMDLADHVHGLVIGTSDLSELALGWDMHEAEHSGMYVVNAGVPKTLVRYVVEWAAEQEFLGEAASALQEIAASAQERHNPTPGPYVLHDFFLYYMVRHQFAPRKIFFMAQQVFANSQPHTYDAKAILHWLGVFYRRFFAQQVKRSGMPDGPQIVSVALSPRAGWRMPSDASASLWLEQLDELEKELSA